MKIMVIGSGPIVIGQAAEFDYAGTQACRALREEGHSVVLVNSNPATIMTDRETADKVYIEPLTVDFCERVIAQERPEGLLPTLGGQTGLNLASALAQEGILEKYNVRLLGTPLLAIQKAEDREEFRALMREINEPVPESWIVENESQLRDVLDKVPYPCIIRPAYTLGGTGGGIASTPEELMQIGSTGLKLSMRSQIMVERSLLGWKEVEYEVMRDSKGNCITICNMENFDPMGVHTGDSIVVAPSQTLSDIEYHMLRTASLKIIRALGIEGGCNVQLAMSPESFDYYVIEVNPRVSRSSALASKATGYPIARVAAKIAVGRTLDEIDNQVTGKTKACFEPALDYCIVKIPRWPFDKFQSGDRTLFTQMKATGEVMAIDRSFEAAFMKAIRGLEVAQKDLWHVKFAGDRKNPAATRMPDDQLAEAIRIPTDERLWAIAEGLRREWGVARVNKLSNVDPWFLNKMEILLENERNPGPTPERIFRMVDTCAGEFESKTPYYYSTTGVSNDADRKDSEDTRETVLVLGSGPIRIGQGIEFDYSCVHCVWALQEMGYRAIIVNNNPETVSTDFDTGDGLYFEPVTFEDVMPIIEHERPVGVVVQFGGQTAINLAQRLHDAGVNVLGTSAQAIAEAEDRHLFESMLTELGISKPAGRAVRSLEEATSVAREVGYPILVRPSFVLGGRAMEIVYSEDQLGEFYTYAEEANPGQPVLVDRYVSGKEIEVDVISDGTDCLVPGIMEHIERAGVHSGDSMAVYPPVSLSREVEWRVVEIASQIARKLKIRGVMNIQFVMDENEQVHVIEVNPRASRTVPYLSKLSGVPIVQLATRCMMGQPLDHLGYGSGLWCSQGEMLSAETQAEQESFGPTTRGLIADQDLYLSGKVSQAAHFAVKAPVFSFQKLSKVEPSLGPEMKSTGEVLGVDRDYGKAIYKAMVGSGVTFKKKGKVAITVNQMDKKHVVEIANNLIKNGIEIVATAGTAEILHGAGIECSTVGKIQDGGRNFLDLIQNGEVSLMINTPSPGSSTDEAKRIRRACIETGIACVTSIDTALALAGAIHYFASPEETSCLPYMEYLKPVTHPVVH
jgi:carbamoyl-phosphate synthase large subunit